MDTNSLEALNKAISEVGSELEKGMQMEELLETIKKLGKEGLKKALPSLSDSQKVLLNEVLIKATDLTKPSQMSDNKTPQKAKEPVTKDVANSEEGVDEADEKLMSDENKTQDHQGGGDSKPEGWQGQVIKSEAREDAKEKIMAMEEKEHGTKDPKKLVEDEKEEHAKKKEMKKSEPEIEGLEKSEIMSKMVERMRKRGMERTKCMDAMKKKGYDHEVAHKLWGEQDEAEKAMTAAEAAVVDAPKKDEPKAKEAPKKMEKSVVWGDPQAALRANTLGRNAHYSVSDEIVKSHARVESLRKSGETFHDGVSETLHKSESGKLDLNEMLAKSEDRSENQMRDQAATLKQSQTTVQSFSEDDFMKAWNPEAQAKLKKLNNKPEPTDAEKADKEAKKMVEKKESGEE